MTEIVPVGSADDVKNVNPYTQGFMADLQKQLEGMQGAADPLNAFMGALPGLFGAAMGGTNPYAQAMDEYRAAATQRVRQNSLEPWADAFYSSGSRDAYAQALGEFETGLARDVLGMRTNFANSMAGYGAGLIGQQTGLFGNLMGLQGSLAAPEYWQPTYMQQNTLLGDIVDVLGAGASLASLFIPGKAPLNGLQSAADLYHNQIPQAVLRNPNMWRPEYQGYGQSTVPAWY